MSGHSKFANIKHKKEKNDAAKGKIFTIIGREIAVAVKEGGPDPNNNSKLRELIAKANELKSLNEQFKARIGELEATEGNLRTMWEGEANDAFHTAFTNDKIQMTNFYNAIEVYIVRLLEIAAKYQQAEAVNTEIATNRTYR